MRFTYQYKTKDGTQHEGSYAASSRTAVYDELKKQGIKPFNVALAPGFFNRLRSYGKRGVAIAVLSLALAVACWFLFTRPASAPASPRAVPRHQIYGDPEILAELERTDYAGVFALPGERLLASYAQPGHTNRHFFNSVPPETIESLASCLTNETPIAESDAREIVELKLIVNGMKEELRAYLADGIGTPRRYAERLAERLDNELTLRKRIVAELAKDESPEAFRKANASLRAIGLRPLVWEAKKEAAEVTSEGVEKSSIYPLAPASKK